MKILFLGDSLTHGRPGCSYITDLRLRLPVHDLVNAGRNGDTAASLYERLKDQGEERYDAAFLWVGVNDVLARRRGARTVLPNNLIFRNWARTDGEFLRYYEKTLAVLSSKAPRIIMVPPLCIGEDPSNQWNRELEKLAGAIGELADTNGNITFLDVREPFFSRLPPCPSPYVPGNAILLLDALFKRTEKELEERAARLGLALTTDGVHLNGRGTRLVSEVFFKALAPILSAKS